MVVLLLLALPFVFYVSNAKAPQDHNAVDRVVIWISSPVQWLTSTVLDGISSVWRSYIYLVGVQDENQRLRAEVASLTLEVQRRDEHRLENERLQAMVGLRDRAPQVPAIFARVIATSPTPLFRSLRVNRGTRHGVHLGAAVTNQDGVVGRVAAVSGWWADVMLLVDANSSMDVIVQRTRARARVRGRGGDGELGIHVELLGRTEDVEPGDVLISSGTGQVFPKGLRVGKVVSVERGRFGLYQKAEVEPSVDFVRIEEVMILPAGWSEGSSFEEVSAESIAAEQVQPGAAPGAGEPTDDESESTERQPAPERQPGVRDSMTEHLLLAPEFVPAAHAEQRGGDRQPAPETPP